jgi:hypothetical protein
MSSSTEPRIAKNIEADEVFTLKVRAIGAIIGVLFAAIGYPLGILVGAKGMLVPVVMLASGVAAGLLAWTLPRAVSQGAGDVFLAFLIPDGSSSPYQKSYSYERSLAVRGRLVEAQQAYESALRANSEDPSLRAEAAEHFIEYGDPRRAAQLLSELRGLRQASRAQALYATQRLIDLYAGSLGEPGRALVELRRLIEQHPGTREADGARQALARFKQASHQLDAPERPNPDVCLRVAPSGPFVSVQEY